MGILIDVLAIKSAYFSFNGLDSFLGTQSVKCKTCGVILVPTRPMPSSGLQSYHTHMCIYTQRHIQK